METRESAAGEVIAVTTTTFLAQSYRLNECPAFGSLVVTGAQREGTAYYGLCAETETASIEPGRHALAWGSADGGDEDVYARQPQLAHVLRTTFTCVLIGYAPRGGQIRQRVPPAPPRVHERVWRAEQHEATRFFDDLSYLRFLLRAGVANTDDLLAASIGYAYHAHDNDRAFLVDAGRAVASLLAADYDRLSAVLELLTAMEQRA